MAINVNKRHSSDYMTKPTSQALTLPCRYHQRNKNQTIPTIITQDQAFNFNTSNQEDPFAPIKDTPGFTASNSDTSGQDQVDWNNMTEEQYVEKCNTYFDNSYDDDYQVVPIPPGMFNPLNFDPTTETTTYMLTMIKEESTPPNAADTPNHTDIPTTTIEDEEEILIPPGMFDIDNEFTTSTPMEEEEDEKSNNCYDNIDNKILQNGAVTNNKKKKQKKAISPETLTS